MRYSRTLDVKGRAFLVALLHGSLKGSEVLVNIPAKLDTVKTRHSRTRLEWDFDAVNGDRLFNSHAVPPYSVALPDLFVVERVPVLLLVAAVGIYTALYQLS